MLFVDGENFTIRSKHVLRKAGIELTECDHSDGTSFAWIPGVSPRHRPANGGPLYLQLGAVRAHYYASTPGGSERVPAIERRLWEMGFTPHVFQKQKDKKTKRVDITIATDILSAAYRNSFDSLILVAGDEDYVPLIQEVKRLGKTVGLWFFEDREYGGLSEQLRIAVDHFIPMDGTVVNKWREYFRP